MFYTLIAVWLVGFNPHIDRIAEYETENECLLAGASLEAKIMTKLEVGRRNIAPITICLSSKPLG